jgi:beta-lactam-binding protein with PASTA domain
MPTQRNFSDDELNQEITQIFPAADRLRLVALDRTVNLAAAKMKSLQRELRIAQARFPAGAVQIREAAQRVELQQRFAVQTTAEIQRGEVTAPVRNPGALILYGRVVDSARVGQPGLVVSAIGADGKARVFTCTNGNGSFILEVPADRKDDSAAVTLLVSDARPAILHRGTEAFLVAGNKVVYREIVLSGDPGKPVPTPPPPVPERVVVPNVVGLNRSRAEILLKRTGLLAEVEETQVDAEKVGLVVAQDPQAGASVEAGSSVKITVGIAGKTVAVPDVVGQTFAEATATLKRTQLGVGAVDPPNPGNDGVVLGQSPKSGTQVERGSFVDLKVQPPIIEPPTVEVPNLVRLTAEEARDALEKQKQKLKLGKTSTQPTTDNQVGRVLSQDPQAGSRVAPGSEVAILVGVKGASKRSAAEILKLVAQEPDFEKVGATEAKLQRIAEQEGIQTEDDLLKIADGEDPAAVRDRFKLRNFENASAFLEILRRVLKRG